MFLAKLFRIVTVAMLVLISTSSAWADPISKEQGDAILNELREIRQLLERSQPAAARPVPRNPDERATVSITGATILGKPTHR